MAKQSWPVVRKRVYPNGSVGWTVDCRFDNQGERLTLKSKAEAQTAAEQARTKRQNEGQGAFSMAPADRADADAALKLLRPHGRTLREAAAFFLKHLAIVKRELSVADLVAELLKSKEGDGASAPYLKDLRNRLRPFTVAFDGQRVTEVSTAAVDDWLRALKVSPVSRNNARRVLGVLFNYGVARGYCLANPIKQTAKVKEVDRPPGILSVAQSARLLAHAGPEILPAIALGFFAGLRPESETWKLRWEDIDFDSRLIDVAADRTKTAQRRFVKMADNLVAWLAPHRPAAGTGAVCPATGDAYFTRLTKARDAAGIVDWPSDALRHTYASMHFAAFRNAGETSEQLGHADLKMLFRHYRERVKPAEALRFWEIRPALALSSPENTPAPVLA